MKENIIKLKSFNFALRIVRVYQYLITEKREFVLSKQLLRLGHLLALWLEKANMQKINPTLSINFQSH